MSVMFIKDDMVLLNHKDYISGIYKNVKNSNTFTSSALQLLPNLFCIILNKDIKGNKLKRNHDYNETLKETNMIKEALTKFISELPEDIKSTIALLNTSNTSDVRDLSRELFESTVFNHTGIIGGNKSSETLKCKIKEDFFLIPQHCNFHCGDIAEQCKKINNKYDILIGDPPWWNKYIRRLKAANNKLSYSMMYNEEIAAIPVQHLFNDNCLVAIWCTNSQKNISAVQDIVFPKWGVTYAATWYWLKITTSFEPICEFSNGCRKQPYERIILGTIGKIKKIPDNRIIFSIPSALHSHKPPLIELLSPYLEEVEAPQTIELFARYLLPNTTSVGYEPLKWQHISLYQCI